MDERTNPGPLYAGLLGFFFLLAYLMSTLVVEERSSAKVRNSDKKETLRTTEKKAAKVEQSKDGSQNDLESEEVQDKDTFDFEEASLPENQISLDEFAQQLNLRADSIRSRLKNGAKRADIIIRYYPHLPDGKIVYSLSDLGFYLHERPTDPNRLENPTNSLFYGDNVPLADIQMVAYNLVKKGVKIRQIKKSRFHDDWKANAIEIGSEARAEKLPVLQFEDIQNFRKTTGE